MMIDVRGKKGKLKILIAVIVLMLVAFRIWLANTSNWQILVQTYYDGHWYTLKALSIATGDWLGDYNKSTLIKSPGYAIFLAVLYLLRIPYGWGFSALIIISSLLFVRALKPRIQSRTWRIIIFLILIYNPIGFSAQSAYLYRNSVTPWFALAAIAAPMAIFLRRNNPNKKMIAWGIEGFFFFGCYYQLREDVVWLLPFMLAAAGIIIVLCVIKYLKNNTKILLMCCIAGILPLVGMWASTTAISLLNQHYYGIYTTNDRTKTASIEVINLLKQIDDGEKSETYWITEEALDMAAEVSPTLAADLDTIKLAFQNWGATYGGDWVGHDLVIWALRDAGEMSGHYTDAQETQEYYNQIVEELEAAFKEGSLQRKKAIYISESSGVYYLNDFVRAFKTTVSTMKYHLEYYACECGETAVSGATSDADIREFESILGTTIVRTDEELQSGGTTEGVITENRIMKKLTYINKAFSDFNLSVYKSLTWIILTLALIGYLLSFVRYVRKKEWEELDIYIICIGVFLTAFLNRYMVTLFMKSMETSVDYFDAYMYTMPVYLFIDVFKIIGLYIVVKYGYDFWKRNLRTIVRKCLMWRNS